MIFVWYLIFGLIAEIASGIYIVCVLPKEVIDKQCEEYDVSKWHDIAFMAIVQILLWPILVPMATIRQLNDAHKYRIKASQTDKED